MTSPDGGPAFPLNSCVLPNGQVAPQVEGMSLLCWFAGQALAGELAAQSAETGEWRPTQGGFEKLAARCYLIADAMLAQRAERAKKGTP